MTSTAIRMLVLAASAAALSVAPASAEPRKLQGIVVTNQNGQLTIKTPAGNQTLGLPANARIRSVSGPLGGQKDEVPSASLLPGLPIVIQGDDSSGSFVINDIEFKAKDYKTAAQIQAGVEETARRSEEMRSAYAKMGQWDIRAEENIYFKSGSSAVSGADRQKLQELAGRASGIKGYVISVLGYADPRGNAAANEQLSNRRAQAVINYLKQSGKVLPGRVLGASAMGEMNIPVEKATDASSLQGARKVTVRVLTSAAHLQN